MGNDPPHGSPLPSNGHPSNPTRSISQQAGRRLWPKIALGALGTGCVLVPILVYGLRGADPRPRPPDPNSRQEKNAHEGQDPERKASERQAEELRQTAEAARLTGEADRLKREGRSDEAVPLAREAAELHRQALGEGHPTYAVSLTRLATLYQGQGDYVRAEPLFQNALEVFDKAYGGRHRYCAAALNNLAVLYQEQGDYARAGPLFEKALRVYEEVSAQGHADYATGLNNLAFVYLKRGDGARAEPLFLKALAVYKRTLGERHALYAAAVNNLAILYQQQGDFAQAEKFLRDALEIRKQVWGARHPAYAGTLVSLATLYQSRGDFDRAEPLCVQALDIYKEAGGERHFTYAAALSSLAVLHQSSGDYDRAEPSHQKALAIIRPYLGASALGQSERQQLRMVEGTRFYLDGYLSLAVLAGRAAGADYAAVLRWKGAVWLRQRQQRAARALRAGPSPEAETRFAELEATSRRLATLALAEVPPGQSDRRTRELAALTDAKERLERELSRLSAAFRREHEVARRTPEQLQQALPGGAALVDFVEYTCSGPDPEKKGRLRSERRLVAFVVRPDRALVRLDLGPVEPVTDAVERWRLTLKRARPQSGEGDPAVALRRLVWQPLEQHLGGAATVLVSPDGPLSRLPFAALPGKAEGKYLVEEVALAVVPVPQLLPELLERKPADPQARPSLLLVGDVDFAAAPGGPGGESPAGRPAPRGAGGKRAEWRALPGTRAELDAVADLYVRRFGGVTADTLSGSRATEEAVKAGVKGHGWLHLATHGFFAPPEVKSALAHGPKPGAGDEFFGQGGVTGWHPGLLSGLVLAGANHEPEAGHDDGILTALEVAELDLGETEMVVLSACETGLGEQAGGEGLLGLQRAFQVAGARTTVTSLWGVPDEATRLLMERMYRNLWDEKKPLGRLEALREAQLWMLREGQTQPGVARGLVREDAPQPLKDGRLPPYYWAAFVLSGDWR